jgi:hypothetical protein
MGPGDYTLWRAINGWNVKQDKVSGSSFDIEVMKSVEDVLNNRVEFIALGGSTIVDTEKNN